MRWVADENIHKAIVEALRGASHDVVYAAETLRQMPDRQLLRWAFDDGRILLTEDKDFGELVFRDESRVAGVVLLRVPVRHWQLKWSRLSETIASRGDALNGHFTTVDPDGIRTQRLSRG